MDAIIGSMTPKERAKPELLNAKRKIRIAKGSGTTVQEVNKLLKMHQEMANAMKKIRKMGGLKGLGAMLGGGGGMGGARRRWAVAAWAAAMPRCRRRRPAGLPGLPGRRPGGLPPGFDKFLKKITTLLESI